MGTYWEIALADYEYALFCKQGGRHRYAVFAFQQFAEKGAKALLEKIEPAHKSLKSNRVETVLAAYAGQHICSDLSDKARYLTSFYFDTRYPGDNYVGDIDDRQVAHAHSYADILKSYYQEELEKIEKSTPHGVGGLDQLDKI